MADPEDFEVGFEGVTDEDGGGTALGCENGKQSGLDFAEGRRGHNERCLVMPDHLDDRRCACVRGGEGKRYVVK